MHQKACGEFPKLLRRRKGRRKEGRNPGVPAWTRAGGGWSARIGRGEAGGGGGGSQRVAVLICQECISSRGAGETRGGASAAIRPNYAAVRGGRQAAGGVCACFSVCVCVRGMSMTRDRGEEAAGRRRRGPLFLRRDSRRCRRRRVQANAGRCASNPPTRTL